MSVDDAVEKKSRRRRRGREEEAEIEEEVERGVTQGKGRATPGKRVSTGKSEESRFFLLRWFGDLRAYISGVNDELDKVVWPTREDLIRLSRMVIIVTIASALVLGAFSIAFTELFILGLEDEWVFLAFGVFVTAAYFIYTRYYMRGSNSDIQPPPY